MLRHAVRLNSLTELALTKLDVLDGFETVKVCTGYRLDGRPLAHYPDRSDVLARVEPVYETLAGWGTGLGEVREPTDLPAAGAGADRARRARGRHPGARRRRRRRARRLRALVVSPRDRALLAPRRWRRCGPTRPASARWLEVELLATEAHAALGVVPADDAAACRERAPVVDDAFVAAVAERERTTDHDVAAFVDVVQERIGPPAGSWIHYGLTSSDVVDTALCWAMRDAADLVLDATDALLTHDRRARPDAPAHRDDRAHPRHPRRADDVRRQGRRCGRCSSTATARRLARRRDVGRRLQAVRRRRHVLQRRSRRRASRRRAARAAPGAGDAGHRPGPPRRVPVGAGVGGGDVRTGRRRAAPPPAHRGGRGARGLQAGPEGLVGDAAQAQPDLRRDDQRPGPRRALQPAWPGCRTSRLWHERDISHSSVERIVLPDSSTARALHDDPSRSAAAGPRVDERADASEPVVEPRPGVQPTGPAGPGRRRSDS